MTATATLVQDAMFAAQILGSDQTAASADVQLVLRRLNRLLDLRSNERQLIFANQTESFVMTAGLGQYSTTLLTNGRPIAIGSMTVTLSQITYSVNMRDQLWWNDQGYKPIDAIPVNCWYDATYPNGTMNFFPRPYGPFVCAVDCQRKLTGPLLLTTDIALPEGYEAWIVAELACDIWPSFKGRQPLNRDLLADRTMARATLKRQNYSPLEMALPWGDGWLEATSNGFLYKGF